jgi:hypothetical protein
LLGHDSQQGSSLRDQYSSIERMTSTNSR